jgi:hypothetical protein
MAQLSFIFDNANLLMKRVVVVNARVGFKLKKGRDRPSVKIGAGSEIDATFHDVYHASQFLILILSTSTAKPFNCAVERVMRAVYLRSAPVSSQAPAIIR